MPGRFFNCVLWLGLPVFCFIEEARALDFPYCSDQFVIYSRKATILGERVQTFNGNVGSARYAEVGEKSVVWGTIVSDTNALLRKRSTVNGLVRVGGMVKKEPGVTVAAMIAEHMEGMEECRIPRTADMRRPRNASGAA